MAVAAILFGEGEHPLVSSLTEAGVPVFEIRLSSRDYLAERRGVRDACLAFAPDIVHTHGYRVDVVDRGVAAGLGIPTATTVHGPSMNGGLKGAFYEWLQRVNYRRFDAVVAVSAALHARTIDEGVRPDRLHLIPNAWSGLRTPLSRADARRALGLNGEEKVVGWVGRLIPVKGGDVFLEALHRLPLPRPLAIMIGHGIEAEALRDTAARMGLGDSVRFHPEVTDAGRLFAAFDTYVLSSRSEGLPVVLLEAMAAGAPIVATRVGGVPEAVRDGIDGLLVPSEDPHALADAIRKCLEDPEAARRRAASASARLVSEFAVEPWLEKYEEIYRSVLPASRSSSRPRQRA